MKQNIKLKQQGVALFVSLMFLIIITVLSLSAMNTSIMEQRMSANSQHSMEALQYAQTIQDYFYHNAKMVKYKDDLLGVNSWGEPKSTCFGKTDKFNGDPCDFYFPADFFDELEKSIGSENLAGLYSAEIIEYPAAFSQSKSTDKLTPYELVVSFNNTANGFGQATVILGYSGASGVETGGGGPDYAPDVNAQGETSQ